MKHNKKIIAIVIIAIVLVTVGIYGTALVAPAKPSEVSSVISFNFEGIDQGLDPYGATFDIQQIKATEVLERTLQTMELEVTEEKVEQLHKAIRLEAYVPGDILERILPQGNSLQAEQLQGIQGQKYHPTQYSVVIEHTDELGLSKSEMQTLVEVLVSEYKAFFIEEYKDTNGIIAAVQTLERGTYDYAEYISIVEHQLQVIQNYLETKEDEANDFKASTTEATFSDLIAEVEILKDVELRNIEALVNTFIVTENSDQLQFVYENRLSTLRREQQQLYDERQSITTTLESYKKEPTVVLDNGTVVAGPQVVPGTSQTLYDQLMEDFIDVESKYSSVTAEIKDYETLLLRMQDLENPIDQEDRAQVIERVNSIGEDIEIFLARVVETTDAYYEEDAFMGSVELMDKPVYRTYFSQTLIKNTLLIIVMSGGVVLVGIVAMLIADITRNKKQSKTVKKIDTESQIEV